MAATTTPSPTATQIIARAYSRDAMQRHAARRAVRSAVGCGLLTRPPHCEGCGQASSPIRRIVAHHPNGYSRDHALDIEWLCEPCHGEAHSGENYHLRAHLFECQSCSRSVIRRRIRAGVCLDCHS